jgi:hypothetical protein
VLELREPGAGHARNLGLSSVRGEYVTFVDDDDRVTSSFLAALLDAAGPDVVACTMVGDVDPDSPPGTPPGTDHYIGRGLGPRAGRTLAGHELVTAFSYNAAKLVRTEIARSARYDTTLRSGEDHVYWLEVFSRHRFRFRVLPPEAGATYLRTVRRGGVSRQERSYDFDVTQRLECLAAIERVDRSHPAVARVAAGLTRGQAEWVNGYLRDHPDEHRRVTEDVRTLGLQELPWQIVNDGLARDLALCYCFPPSLDTSGLVAAKRLRERGLVVDVISHDLTRIRAQDTASLRLVEEVLDRTHVIPGVASFDRWKAVAQYVASAWAVVEDWEQSRGPYRSVYSRAMAVNSHYAAAVVKLRRPGTEWVAEFSDPLKVNALGQERIAAVLEDDLTREIRAGVAAAGFTPPATRRMFAWAEEITFALADRIIFTNQAQMDLMLEHCADPRLADRAREVGEVQHHPSLPSAFYDLGTTELALDDGVVNLGYFGVFYATRDLGDVVTALRGLRQDERDRIRLHVFTTDPDALTLEVVRAGLAGVVVVRPYVPVLEFLHLTRQFDVLVVNDAITGTHHSRNPYLPSKVADYRGSGTPVWAIYEEGSTLSSMPFARRSPLGDADANLAVLRDLLAEQAAQDVVAR